MQVAKNAPDDAALGEAFPEEGDSPFAFEYRRAMVEQVTSEFEAYFEPLHAWFEVHAYPSPEGLSVYVRDVTERKRTEGTRARLAAIIESTPDFVGSFDGRGRAMVLNQAARRMLRIPEREDVTSHNRLDLYPTEVAQRVLGEGIPAALRDGVWRAETTIRSRDEGTCPVSQVLLAHRDASGEVAFFSTVMRDITDAKRAEELQRFLAEVSRTLAGSLEYEATLESVAHILVPRLADFCIVYVCEGDALRARVMAHTDPAAEQISSRGMARALRCRGAW
ncbi:hypothetical protein DAT35_57725 [Vitiosangium sp. GDMCC 1.1324]|nr:hypothetical protein DAT35_57725 [Vitiosangium sp. GDMCC 1.1324]